MDVRTKNNPEQDDLTHDLEVDVQPAKAVDPLTAQAKKLANRVHRPQTGKVYPLDRRTMHQTYGHALAMLDRLWSFRDEARKKRHLDDVQFTTEAIYHLKQSIAYMNILSRHNFSCDAEDLSNYK